MGGRGSSSKTVRLSSGSEREVGDGLIHGYNPDDPYGIDWDFEGDGGYTESEIDGLVSDWAGMDYTRWRWAVSGLRPLMVRESDYRRAGRFDTWLDAGAYDGEIHRGINVNDSVLETFRVGAVISQVGMSSWTTDASIADEFSSYNDYNRVVFHMPDTSHGRAIFDIPGSMSEESEVTVSSRSQQAITAVKRRKNGIIDIYVKEV